MNTFMPRMLFLTSMTLSLILSGCGSKEIEPYQGATEAASTSEMETATTYPLSYGALQEEQGSIDEENMQGSIGEENLSAESMASLTENLPMPEEDDNTPIIETLDAGSGAGEQKLGFGDRNNKSATYKKEHGRSSVQLKPVYFDFDKSNIRNDQVASIEHDGEYLKSNVASKVLIEGNCDETGTNEYNLALGERRAMNAKKYLIKLGVDSVRIRTISYGEERPLFTGSEDSDHAYNRRDDFILE
ncbi:OmpA family protein [Desulfobulbus sp. US2]|uniref:Peptidoglycan-associated lipoprotein n=1 Tax=Candidatus Electrothrix communis TaxID=1859133 RepID=A0A444J9V9_9BACT|nr:OmpA family protein [Desulfobulbus sp. US4]MCW5207103.1 OmpA family protein [Desulfobulbus sp. US2]RWX49860.1 OmpA family protein [Candidatus Electrothrix communis]WLE95939.1 MAG: OmpA family protein [Candidatus Electrothrix communis]